MIRIPVGNERTARIEVRSVAPDANPYLLLHTLIQAGLDGEPLSASQESSEQVRLLPGAIQEAMDLFEGSSLMRKVLGETNVEKYLSYNPMPPHPLPHDLAPHMKTPT